MLGNKEMRGYTADVAKLQFLSRGERAEANFGKEPEEWPDSIILELMHRVIAYARPYSVKSSK